ncbi:MAG: hypothetical protein HY700_21915 [Gemmatimonadetes bacterium]|nr:hypothetical protein [Gemmatimonadota bacterium]
MRYSLKVLLCFALTHGVWPHPARAQTPSERQAAKETSIDGLRLLDAALQEPRLTALGVHLGYVERDTRPGDGKYFCGALSRDQSRAAGAIVSTALSKLSEAPLRKLRLRYVILCGEARSGGQRIGGIPVPPLDLLMLDVGETDGNRSYLQHIFLHELFHLIEFRFDTYQDTEWHKLFGTGYANSYTGQHRQSAVGGGKRGFLNAYAETYPHEDRAELFASLLLNPADVVAYIRATKDEVLRQKALYLMQKCERLLGLRTTVSGL